MPLKKGKSQKTTSANIKELNKKMNNFERVKRKRDEYLKSLETKKE